MKLVARIWGMNIIAGERSSVELLRELGNEEFTSERRTHRVEVGGGTS